MDFGSFGSMLGKKVFGEGGEEAGEMAGNMFGQILTTVAKARGVGGDDKLSFGGEGLGGLTNLSSLFGLRGGGHLLPRKHGQPGIKKGDPGSHDKPLPVSTMGGASSTRGGKSYSDLKQELLESGSLWEDPDFPAVDESLYFSQSPPRDIEWLRPHEISGDPKLFVEGASRFDIQQGELGDCWLLAAVASLTLSPKLLARVVPHDQSFEDGEYCGAFHFEFWQYGTWVDVIVDDRLPTYCGKLVYMHSEEQNEFWSALLEKAYSKLHGSYESLKGGTTCEAMEDFTGGVTEMYDLQKAPSNLFHIMRKSLERHGMLGCSIQAVPDVTEAQLDNGLICGHAYSVTACALPEIETSRISGKIPMVRIRNPWGNEAEWKGAFSDQSPEWQMISEEEKENMGLTFDADGEFWMTYKDFIENYQRLEICNLGPDAWEDFEEEAEDNKKWEMNLLEGSWVRGCNAGGCRNYLETFWTNPQFRVTLEDPDEDDEEEKCTCIIGLMQKGRRAKRKEGEDLLTIGYAVYKLKEEYVDHHNPLDKSYFTYNASAARSPSFINLREVSNRVQLPPGTYVIVPSTFEPNEQAEFILRVFSEKANLTEHFDEESGFDVSVKPPPPAADDAMQSEKLADVFSRVSGEDMEIDYLELKEVLDAVLTKEFDFDGFSLECCRSMVAMLDMDRSGKLGLAEFRELWRDIRWWKNVFKEHDKDNSGCLNTFELREALRSAGYRLGSDVLKTMVLRYGNKDNTISFDDFIMCSVKLKTLMDKFNQIKATQMSLDDVGDFICAAFC